MNILITYDNTIHAATALNYGIAKVRRQGGELLLIQVFDPRLFVDYDAGPQAEQAARHEARQGLEQAKRLLQQQASGVPYRISSAEGDVRAIISGLVQQERPDLVLTQPGYREALKFLTVPVYVIPGLILVPVDGAASLAGREDDIVREARATNSKILLAGIVPVHLYSKEEKQELERVKKATKRMVAAGMSALRARGVEVVDTMRAGYPDVEILKTAEEYSVSLIMLPSGGATPSELTKAAEILMEEPARLRWPLLRTPAEA